MTRLANGTIGPVGRRGSPAGSRVRRPPNPDRLLLLMHGHWAAAAIAVAVQASVFDLVDAGCRTSDAIGGRAGLSRKGGAALLSALVGLGLLKVRRDAEPYRNSAEAAAYLVADRFEYPWV